MRVTVFGANGRTGRLVVDGALQRGWQVVAVVRREPDPALPVAAAVVVGDPRDPGVIAGAIAGSGAVVSALGPVAEVTRTEVSETTATIVQVVSSGTTRRLILPANSSVFSDGEVTGEYANVAAEHRRDVATVRGSDIDWTVVVTGFLSDDQATGRVAVAVDEMPAAEWVTRGDFAATMLDAIDHADWVGHLIGVANPA
jgi:putative NADH-flavin reductase